MDVEWADVDGLSNELFIVQARPETIHSQKDNGRVHRSIKWMMRTVLKKSLLKGIAVGDKIASGKVRRSCIRLMAVQVDWMEMILWPAIYSYLYD